MIRQIVIEAEPADDSQPVFRLSINANLIAKGVTVAQAHYLVGEVLGRSAIPEHAEMLTFNADRSERENMGPPKAEKKATLRA
jgi:hypothetical protein